MEITIKIVMDEKLCPECTESEIINIWNGRKSLTATEVVKSDLSIFYSAPLLNRILVNNDQYRFIARQIAKDVLRDQYIPKEYKAWLETGNESLRLAAWNQAREAPCGATWEAARCASNNISKNATWTAAWAAAKARAKEAEFRWYFKVKEKSFEEYVLLMAKFLDKQS